MGAKVASLRPGTGTMTKKAQPALQVGVNELKERSKTRRASRPKTRFIRLIGEPGCKPALASDRALEKASLVRPVHMAKWAKNGRCPTRSHSTFTNSKTSGDSAAYQENSRRMQPNATRG